MGQVMSDNSFSDSIRKAVELWIETGEDRHFTVVYTKIQKGLYGHIFKIVKDEDTAMDIMSETFLLIINKKHQYDSNRANFTTWAYHIAKNTALAYLNHEKKQDENRVNGSQFIYDLVGNSASNFHPEEGESQTDYTYSTEKYDEDDESLMLLMHQRALQEIMTMSDTYRDFLYDREIRKLTYEDIAIKHGIKMNTVKSKIRLGREIIKSKLIDYGKSIGIHPDSLSKLFGYCE